MQNCDCINKRIIVARRRYYSAYTSNINYAMTSLYLMENRDDPSQDKLHWLGYPPPYLLGTALASSILTFGWASLYPTF